MKIRLDVDRPSGQLILGIQWIVLISSISLTYISAAHVLVLSPMSPWSHKNVFVPMISSLAERGHDVTVVSAWKTPETLTPNKTQKAGIVKDIIPLQGFKVFPNINMIQVRKYGLLGLLGQSFDFVYEACHTVYQNKEVQSLLSVKFDLIIMDSLLNECMLGFVNKNGAPLVWISTAPPVNAFTQYMGNRLPPSYVPNTYLAYTDEMTFSQRVLNTFFDFLTGWRMSQLNTEFEKIYKQYLEKDVDEKGNLIKMPSVTELQATVSFCLSNSDVVLNHPIPKLPDLVEVGGVHCRPGRVLPKDIDDFLSGAKDGAILFSLGTIFRSHEMPKETLAVFLNVFSKLKQRVLWKWDDESIQNLPPNVKIAKWTPQQDVLAHKNIKLFMSHGGLLSTQEAVYHGVPILGVPLFADQDLNIKKAEMAGIAKSIEILEVNEEELHGKIQGILNDSGLKTRMKNLSSIFRDQKETPLERAVFWLEYLIRYQGAPHLRSAARNLNFFQYHSLDVAALVFVILLSILFIIKCTVKCIFKRLCPCKSKSNKNPTKVQSRNVSESNKNK